MTPLAFDEDLNVHSSETSHWIMLTGSTFGINEFSMLISCNIELGVCGRPAIENLVSYYHNICDRILENHHFVTYEINRTQYFTLLP